MLCSCILCSMDIFCRLFSDGLKSINLSLDSLSLLAKKLSFMMLFFVAYVLVVGVALILIVLFILCFGFLQFFTKGLTIIHILLATIYVVLIICSGIILIISATWLNYMESKYFS